MPQVQIGSANIETFIFNATFNLYQRTITLDASPTIYNGSGISNVLGIAFSIIDGDGVELATIDFNTPQLPTPATNSIYTLDLTSVNFAFLFQSYKIVGAIKDSTGTIYQTTEVFKKVCQPVNLTESGYVPGLFQITPDCVNNTLTVKEISVLVYNNEIPLSVTKTGTLSYPTGTISPLTFSNTPFSNNVIYTGQYRINCMTIATYDLGDGVYVAVTYLTNNQFDVTCNNRMADLMCCLVNIQQTAVKNCNTAIGQHAKQQLDEITPAFLIGLTKEINGQDASTEAMFIKKALNCNCGTASLGQNEISPVNPSVYDLVLIGVGGTTVPSATVTGSTKTYNIASNVYQVVKGDTGDLAWSIVLDTSVANTVKYKITFNYNTMAGYILTAIGNDPTLLNQLNSLVTAVANISLVGLNGSCVIDMTQADYTLIQSVNNSTFITSITINGVVHNAPSNLFGTDFIGIGNWLNSLSLGSFTVGVSSGILLIQSLNNTNTIATMTFTTPNVTTPFQSTNKTLLQVLQAIIDYLCGMTSLQVALGNNLSLCLFDYNGTPISYSYSGITNSQADYNLGISQAICNIVARMNTLAGITCAALRAAFPDSPNASFGGAGRLYGTDGTNCIGWNNKQIATLVIAAINSYSDVKAAFCAIDCAVPGTCPDIVAINMSMVGSSIGVYGVTWTQTPVASQTVTVRYRVSGTTTYTVSTNSLLILPNGNVSTSPPYLIPGAIPGTTYDIFMSNNCGGSGFVGQITAPSSTVYSGSYLLDNVIYNICGESPVTLYSSSPFATGVTMYTDIGLTVVLTGYTYISSSSGGNIFQIDTTTGIVGSDTLSACTSGTAGIYIRGNNTATICAGLPHTLYTNGVFAVGGILYDDVALTTPTVGFSYVVNTANNHIYNINSGTGAIVSDTGLSCSGTVQISNNSAGLSIDNITGISGFTLSSPVPDGGLAAGTHNPFTGTIGVDISGIGFASALTLFINGIAIECIDIPVAGTYTFGSQSYGSSDSISITLEVGSC
jgi:hypothetical protein